MEKNISTTKYKVNPLGIYVYPGLTKVICNISFKVNSINHFNNSHYINYFRMIKIKIFGIDIHKLSK